MQLEMEEKQGLRLGGEHHNGISAKLAISSPNSSFGKDGVDAAKGDGLDRVEKESRNGCSSDCHKELEKQISTAKGGVDEQVQGSQNLAGGSKEGELQPMEEIKKAEGRGCGTGDDHKVKDQNEATHMEFDGGGGSCTT